MKTVGSFADVRRTIAGQGTVGLVPTMGYFHEGHLSLMRAARRESDVVVVSLFVNPRQFGPTEDLERYPRDPDRDAALAEGAGVDLLFAPPLGEMYSDRFATTVVVGGPAEMLEGKHRAGHFEGVAIAVAKLFAGIRPDLAFFGRKDAQQLAVIRRMAADLSFPVVVRGCPTVREADGLALSSRNVYLDPDQRRAALLISGGLLAAGDAVERGTVSGFALEEAVRDVLASEPMLELDYVALVDREEVRPVEVLDGPAFLAVAARVGGVRLIDNIHIDMDGGRFAVDRGTRLDEPSVLYDGRG